MVRLLLGDLKLTAIKWRHGISDAEKVELKPAFFRASESHAIGTKIGCGTGHTAGLRVGDGQYAVVSLVMSDAGGVRSKSNVPRL